MYLNKMYVQLQCDIGFFIVVLSKMYYTHPRRAL